jgi:hypothetical protein
MQFEKDLQLEKARKKLLDTAQKFLKGQHTFHKTAAVAHETSANDFEKGSSEHTHHSTMAAAHTAAADSCLACMEECSKVVWSDLFKAAERAEPVASPISAVVPNAPGLRSVPRAGQQPIPAAPEVDARLAHLTKVEG